MLLSHANGNRLRDTATLHIKPFTVLTEHDAIAEEGQRLLAFASAEAALHDITLTPIA